MLFRSAFLAILDSVKARRIIVMQNRLFGDIRIKRREEPDQSLGDDELEDEIEDQDPVVVSQEGGADHES